MAHGAKETALTTHNTPDSKQEALTPEQMSATLRRLASSADELARINGLSESGKTDCVKDAAKYRAIADYIDASRASVAAVEGESDYDYAVRLARHLMTSRFPVEGWAPLPTLSGVLSQIDNMIAGLTKPKPTMRDLALRHTEQGLRAAASSPAPAEPPMSDAGVRRLLTSLQRPCECTDHDPQVCLNGEVDEGSRYCHCECHTPAEPLQPTGEQERPRCSGCGQEIDPEVCGCGQLIDHGYDNHLPIPMGCNCYLENQSD